MYLQKSFAFLLDAKMDTHLLPRPYIRIDYCHLLESPAEIAKTNLKMAIASQNIIEIEEYSGEEEINEFESSKNIDIWITKLEELEDY